MQKQIFSWLGREFVELSAAARLTASVEEETDSLFRSFEQELKACAAELGGPAKEWPVRYGF